ncbi:MAG: hypothetical protein H0U23_14435, partial [Blastocatellia bacterium]|nr:hypothetical protein [Blastocatellia bacterium]
HLGGRFQDSMPADVAARLKEITVDPKTVTLAKKVDASGPDVNIGGKWIMVVEAPGQAIELTAEFKQDGTVFAGTSTSMIGTAVFEAGKVSGKMVTAKLKADIQGQPVEFVVEGIVDGDKMSGTVSGGGFGSMPFTATRAK